MVFLNIINIKRRLQLIVTIYFLSVIFLLSGCNTHQHPDKKIFHYNEQTGIASLDPAFAKNQSIMWAIHQLYNTLVEVDSQLNIVPSLARSWNISDDKKTYTFHLREDVFFHDDPCFPGGKGRKMTAGDIRYSLYRIINRETASPGSWIFNNKLDSAQGFVAIDDTTFQVKLRHP